MTDARLQTAFQIVARNCGLSPAASRLLKAHPMVSGKIASLAGTAPEYQRHVVGRLLAGERNPFRPSTLLVYDTVGFNEVTNRLHRALGTVRLEANYLDEQIRRDVRPNRLADRLRTLDLIVEQAGGLRELLHILDVRPGGPKKKPKKRERTTSAEEGSGKLYAPSALGLQ